MVKTDGDAGDGGDVRVEREEDADDGLAADAGGGSAEASRVEVVDSAGAGPVAGPVTVPTVRVKLAVTMW